MLRFIVVIMWWLLVALPHQLNTLHLSPPSTASTPLAAYSLTTCTSYSCWATRLNFLLLNVQAAAAAAGRDSGQRRIPKPTTSRLSARVYYYIPRRLLLFSPLFYACLVFFRFVSSLCNTKVYFTETPLPSPHA